MALGYYKNRFPFKVGCPSYIYPVEENNLIYNVKTLAPHFDSIQLLLFGVDYIDEMLETKIIHDLSQIKTDNSLHYDIHLPLDLNLIDSRSVIRRKSITCMKKIMESTSILEPDSFILHLDVCNNFTYPPVNLSKLKNELPLLLNELQSLFPGEFLNIIIENTSYDILEIIHILNKADLKICLDTGHLLLHQKNVEHTLSNTNRSTAMIHLHGVHGNKDHAPVHRLPQSWLSVLKDYLNTFTGTVIVEVFNERDLIESMETLDALITTTNN